MGVQRGREALAATVAVFQIALLVESSVSSQDPPEADKSDGRLLRRLDRVDEARLAYERALELVSSDAERRCLERRLAGLQPR